MDGRAVSGTGLGVALDFTGDDSDDFCARNVVYFGRRVILFVWGDILSVAATEICACTLAFVCYRGQCVFLFCSALWFNHRFCNKVHSIIKPPFRFRYHYSETGMEVFLIKWIFGFLVFNYYRQVIRLS